jgi:hypothetical protein
VTYKLPDAEVCRRCLIESSVEWDIGDRPELVEQYMSSWDLRFHDGFIECPGFYEFSNVISTRMRVIERYCRHYNELKTEVECLPESVLSLEVCSNCQHHNTYPVFEDNLLREIWSHGTVQCTKSMTGIIDEVPEGCPYEIEHVVSREE